MGRRRIGGTQQEVVRYLNEQGEDVLQQHISRYTTRGKRGARPTPKFALQLRRGLELDELEQLELSWADLFGERIPPGLMRRLQVFEESYARLVAEGEGQRYTSSNTTSGSPRGTPEGGKG